MRKYKTRTSCDQVKQWLKSEINEYSRINNYLGAKNRIICKKYKCSWIDDKIDSALNKLTNKYKKIQGIEQ